MAVMLDHLLGEPRRWHPLVGFGWLAEKVEQRFNRGAHKRLSGLCGLLMLIIPPLACTWFVSWAFARFDNAWVSVGLSALVVYWAIGWRSLNDHVRAVHTALAEKNLPLARAQVARIVSRDCSDASVLEVRRAAIESALENSSDAVIAPLFWFAVAGLPGVVVYRLSNTLDAMWGYRNPRFAQFGWAAARWDDVLNLVPARLTALGFAACGGGLRALRAWRRDAPGCASPNAGPVICAGAGALDVRLGGPARYGEQLIDKPWVGCARSPEDGDVLRSLVVVRRCVGFWLMVWSIGWLMLRLFV